jgi:hypothetical protein
MAVTMRAPKQASLNFKRKYFKMAHKAFEMLSAIFEAPGYPLLKHYKNDFLGYDKEFLDAQTVPQSTFILAVRLNGTQTVRLGVHAKHEEWMHATLSSTDEGGKEFYLITIGDTVADVKIAKITPDKVKSQLGRRFAYRVYKGRAYHKGEVIADMVVTRRWDADSHERLSTVTYSRREGLAYRDIPALLLLAQYETGSIWTKIEAITVDGENISDLMTKRDNGGMLPRIDNNRAAA